MADDPNPALSAELLAARDVVEPQLRGLADLIVTTTSGALHDALVSVNAQRHHRDDLLKAALAARDAYIDALNVLEADGYPALPNVQIEASLLAEMQAEESDIDAAVAIFEGQAAAMISVHLGEPVPKT